MTSELTLKRPRKEFLQELRKELLAPLTIANFLLVILLPFWIGPAIYLILRTLLFDPAGIIAWTLVGALSATILVSWTLFFKGMFRYSKVLKPVLITAKQGDQSAIAKVIELRKTRPRLRLMTVGYVGLLLLIPLVVAISLSNALEGTQLVRQNGRLRPATHREEIQFLLKSIEHQGILGSKGSDIPKPK